MSNLFHRIRKAKLNLLYWLKEHPIDIIPIVIDEMINEIEKIPTTDDIELEGITLEIDNNPETITIQKQKKKKNKHKSYKPKPTDKQLKYLKDLGCTKIPKDIAEASNWIDQRLKNQQKKYEKTYLTKGKI